MTNKADARLFLIGCSLVGFLCRSDDEFAVQAADAVEQADAVMALLDWDCAGSSPEEAHGYAVNRFETHSENKVYGVDAASSESDH